MPCLFPLSTLIFVKKRALPIIDNKLFTPEEVLM